MHTGGDAVDPDDLELVVHVDGDPLSFQPPVPFGAWVRERPDGRLQQRYS